MLWDAVVQHWFLVLMYVGLLVAVGWILFEREFDNSPHKSFGAVFFLFFAAIGLGIAPTAYICTHHDIAESIGLKAAKPATPTPNMVTRVGNGVYDLMPLPTGYWAVYHEGSAVNGRRIDGNKYAIPPTDNAKNVAFYIVVADSKSNPLLVDGLD